MSSSSRLLDRCVDRHHDLRELCAVGRWCPGPWVGRAGRAISVVLLANAVLFVSVRLAEGRWSLRVSPALALGDVALIAVVEGLTYL